MSRVILVTGANTGIGFELVRLLAEKGHKVYLGARNEAAGKEAEYVGLLLLSIACRFTPISSPRGALKKDNLDVEYIHLDVTDQGSITAAREYIERSEGRLDVLVNNAGMYMHCKTQLRFTDVLTVHSYLAGASFMHKPQVATDVDVFVLRDAFEPNLFGLVQTTTTLLPLSQQGPGVILNVTTDMASNAEQAKPNSRLHFVAYNTSKAAANSYTIALNHELRVEGSQIRVNCVTPGFTTTKLNNYAAGGKTSKQAAEVLLPWALLDAEGPTGD